MYIGGVNIDPNSANELIKVMNSEVGKELSLPASHEFGALFGEIASVIRFYGTENLKSIFTKWSRSRHPGKVIEATEFKRVMPLLSTASMESNDELQDRWAALLETAASGDKDYLPSYGQTLSQLTVQEARLLSAVWAWITNPEVERLLRSPRQLFTARQILSIFQPDINPNLMFYRGHREDMSPELISLIERADEVEHIIDDLVRLGIFEVIRETGPSEYVRIKDYKIPTINNHPKVTVTYRLTLYGQKFIRAVTSK